MSQKLKPAKRLGDPLKKAASFRMKSKKKDDIRDGKLFHIRVTIGYLTALRTTELPGVESSNQQIVSAYASFAPTEEDRGEYDFATSLPLAPNMTRQGVKWPKGTDVKTSKRRLYHSLILRKSTAMLGSSPFSPELVNIFVGLKRGDESISVGMATLVLTGEPEMNRKIDLPVRRFTVANKSKAEDRDESNRKSRSGIKNFFSKRHEKAPASPKKNRPNTFNGDNKRYTFEKNAVIQVKVNVMEGVYQTNGPGLWGDLEDDEESFGPVPVIDIPEECTAELTDRYDHESIEVMQFKKGTTIISAPGNGEALERIVVGRGSKNAASGATEIEDFLAKPVHKIQHLVCGKQEDVISEMPLTSSYTDGEDYGSSDESDSESESESETESRSVPESQVKKSYSQYEASVLFERDFDGSSNGTDIDGSDTDEDSFQKTEWLEAEQAKEVLLRYASRLGMPVEELLEAARSDASAGTSSFESSRGNSRRDNPESALYPGEYSGGEYSYSHSTFDHSEGSNTESSAGLPFKKR
jgi:hypothetical protein